MRILTKSLLSAGAAAAALVSVAVPAQARDRYDNDRISAGEVIAGAVILGGLAAVIASSGKDRGRGYYDDRSYNRDGYDYNRSGYDYNRSGYNNRYGGSRQAVSLCVNAVETWSNRYSRSEVTEIRNIQRTRGGYRITGKVVVQDGWRGQDRGYNRYERNDGYGNRNGYEHQGYARGYDQGRFTCQIERGRVVDIDYSGLDQWR